MFPRLISKAIVAKVALDLPFDQLDRKLNENVNAEM